LNHVVDGIPECHRQEGKALQKKMGLKGGIPSEELVPAISAQNSFDLRRRQAGEEPGRNKGGISQWFVQARVNLGKGGDNIAR
jgi:hypothetical protein